MLPTLGVAGLAVLLAFVLGRASGGGSDGEVRAAAGPSNATTTTTRTRTHTVAQGESLLAIASRYGVTLDQLAAANGITNANHVFVGQVLQIPPPTVPTAGPGVTTPTSAANGSATTSTTRRP